MNDVRRTVEGRRALDQFCEMARLESDYRYKVAIEGARASRGATIPDITTFNAAHKRVLQREGKWAMPRRAKAPPPPPLPFSEDSSAAREQQQPRHSPQVSTSPHPMPPTQQSETADQPLLWGFPPAQVTSVNLSDVLGGRSELRPSFTPTQQLREVQSSLATGLQGLRLQGLRLMVTASSSPSDTFQRVLSETDQFATALDSALGIDRSTDPFEIVTALGVHSLRREPLGSVEAFVETTEDGVIVRLNSARPPVRQRFSLAHEIAHVLLGHMEGHRTISLGERVYKEAHTRERLCDLIAVEILMPAARVVKLVRRTGTSLETAEVVEQDLQRVFLVCCA